MNHFERICRLLSCFGTNIPFAIKATKSPLFFFARTRKGTKGSEKYWSRCGLVNRMYPILAQAGYYQRGMLSHTLSSL
jgi:hypothetical protein